MHLLLLLGMFSLLIVALLIALVYIFFREVIKDIKYLFTPKSKEKLSQKQTFTYSNNGQNFKVHINVKSNNNFNKNNKQIYDAEVVSENISNNTNKEDKISDNIVKYNNELNNMLIICKDEDIKHYIKELIDVMDKIEKYVAEHKQLESDINILYDYYIPELLNQLKIYNNMDNEDFHKKHGDNIKNNLIETISMITSAYNTVLSEFYDKLTLSVSSNLEALKLNIKKKGLS